jgi:hypothetical protein
MPRTIKMSTDGRVDHWDELETWRAFRSFAPAEISRQLQERSEQEGRLLDLRMIPGRHGFYMHVFWKPHCPLPYWSFDDPVGDCIRVAEELRGVPL